jgi:hypothetical protein
MKSPRLVTVRVRDCTHYASGEWVDRDDLFTGATITVSGYVLRRTRHWLALASTLGPDNTATGVFVVPVAAIVKQARK